MADEGFKLKLAAILYDNVVNYNGGMNNEMPEVSV